MSQSLTAPNLSQKKEVTSILDNPYYKKSPFYPFADDVRRKEADIKRTHAAIDDLYGKIK